MNLATREYDGSYPMHVRQWKQALVCVPIAIASHGPKQGSYAHRTPTIVRTAVLLLHIVC
jgi:hypothetical protein